MESENASSELIAILNAESQDKDKIKFENEESESQDEDKRELKLELQDKDKIKSEDEESDIFARLNSESHDEQKGDSENEESGELTLESQHKDKIKSEEEDSDIFAGLNSESHDEEKENSENEESAELKLEYKHKDKIKSGGEESESQDEDKRDSEDEESQESAELKLELRDKDKIKSEDEESVIFAGLNSESHDEEKGETEDEESKGSAELKDKNDMPDQDNLGYSKKTYDDYLAKKIHKTEEELMLEKMVFGGRESFISRLEKKAEKRVNEDDEDYKVVKKRKPVWNDSDDDNTLKVGDVLNETKYTGSLKHLNKEKSYKDYLTKKYERIVPVPKWADLDREEEIDSDEEILKTVGHLSDTKSANLISGTLMYKKLKDLNRATYCEGSISEIHFHPSSTVAIVSGEHGVATVYSMDGLKNDKLHSMQFKNFPIKCSNLLSNGKDMIFGSLKNFCYCYDLIQATATRVFLPKEMTTLKHFKVSPDNNYIAAAGRFGEIHLLDIHTKELIHTFKQEDNCTALKFSNDSKKILAHSRTSNITIFDIRQQKVDHIFTDEGCIYGKCLAISPNNSLLATGSNEGVVNVYNYSDIFNSANPVPQKVLYNLRTSITDLKFNSTGEMLGMCSKKIHNAIKLVHFPTATVYSNFPNFEAKFGKVRRLDFSPNSGFLALGNVQGKVPLLRLKHYNNY